MYDAIAHSDTANLSEQDKNLYVISTGFYDLSPGDSSLICDRPKGRADYHFYCVVKGKSRCTVNGKEYTLSQGQAVFYESNSPQKYEHVTDSGTKIYWIHFDGNNAKKLLNECGFAESCIFDFDTSVTVHFENILNELIFRNEMYIKASSASLYSIIVSFARGLNPQNPRDECMQKVLYMMHNKAHYHLTLADYAKIGGLSKSQFIKRFTAYTGVTPIQYKNKQIVMDAEWYLKNTNTSIKELSEILKFENAYYFSNMFKKNAGMSPKKYREKYVFKNI